MTNFAISAQGQGVNSLTLSYPYAVNNAQMHHLVIVAANVQIDEGAAGTIMAEVWASPEPELDSVVNLTPIEGWDGAVYWGESYRRPRLRVEDTGIEIRLPPGVTADLIVSLDEQAEGGQVEYGINQAGQTFDGDLSLPDPPGVNPWYYSGEWIAAITSGPPSISVPPGWTLLTQETTGTYTLSVIRRDLEPWITRDQLLPSGTFDSGVPQTTWRYSLHATGAIIYPNPYEVLAQPGDTIQVNVNIYRGFNGWYQGTLEFAIISSPYVSASIEPPLAAYPVDLAVMTVTVAADAPRGSHQYVSVGSTTGGGLEYNATVQIAIATSSGGGGEEPPPSSQIDLYRRWLVAIAPPWLQNERGRAVLGGMGEALDEHVSLLVTGLLARFARRAPEDALTRLGSERNLIRYPSESNEAYRARVLGAWETWRWAGTKAGIEAALRVLGYVPQVVENYLVTDTNARWAEWSMILRTATPQGSVLWADDGMWDDDGGLWGTQITAAEVQRILGVINQVKAAHSVCSAVIYVASGTIWGEVGDGNWQDDGVWDDGETVDLYRRY